MTGEAAVVLLVVLCLLALVGIFRGMRTLDRIDLAMRESEGVAVGRCGAMLPTNSIGLTPLWCALPDGHRGWHKADDGAEWTRVSS